MATNTINAEMLKKMFLAGAANLDANKEMINELNVYLNSKEKELAACYANLRKAALDLETIVKIKWKSFVLFV